LTRTRHRLHIMPSPPHKETFQLPTPHHAALFKTSQTDSELSDDPMSLSSPSDHHRPITPQPVSLLTALLTSPDHRVTSKTHTTGTFSARSSAPSTAVSSPSHHGILTSQNHSILRRGSMDASSDGGEHGFMVLDRVEEKAERIGWADGVRQEVRNKQDWLTEDITASSIEICSCASKTYRSPSS
jgi:hypothetical protein